MYQHTNQEIQHPPSESTSSDERPANENTQNKAKYNIRLKKATY